MGVFRDIFRKNSTLIITLAVLALLYIAAIQGMSTKDWVITTLRGLSVGAVTFLVASGLSLIFGLMDVLNLAHGTLFMIGAYIGWSAFVRPDTFVDLFPLFVLPLVTFLLMPLWKYWISKINLPAAAQRIWPWVGLVLAFALLAYVLPRYPIAIWNAAVYSDSPVTWTQNFTNGLIQSLVKPAEFQDHSLAFFAAGLLLVGLVASISLAGLSNYRHKTEPAAGFKIRWQTIAAVSVLLLLGIGFAVFNDQITNFLLGISTNWLFLFAILVALLAGAGLGGLMEATLIRPLYARPLYQLMLTLGLGVIGTEFVRAFWGRSGFTMPRPALFEGTGEGCPATSIGAWLHSNCSTLLVTIAGEETRIRVYNEVFVILAGLLVLIIVWALLHYTRLGMTIRAGVQDSEMVEALGINVRRVFTLVFALGASLAALGGVLSGPATGLSDLMGANLLLTALIALAIGGLTSFPGSALGAVIVGLLQQFIIKYGQIGIHLPILDITFKPTPPLVPASTVLLMVIILLVMPQGLLGRKE
jgi:branched-chain amino acid transport system permease protein